LRKERETNLDGTFLENHTASGHDLLVRPIDVKVPSPGMVCEEVGDVAAM
jgi:hypothetical protein